MPPLSQRLPPAVVTTGDRLLALRQFDAARPSAPPHRTRRRQLLRLVQERGHRAFVESGTYRGDTVAFLEKHVERIWSIEIEPALYERAAARFAGSPNVTIIRGDATEHLPRVLRDEVTTPALIFLDGHFSGGVTGMGDLTEPAVEILSILAGAGVPPGSTIVVDDVRLFGGDPEFPTLDALIDAAREAFPSAQRVIELDALILRV